jgi:enoyl-CoA hydratase/carnithine racemase
MGLNYEKKGHIVKVGINRPKEWNVLDSQILVDLHHTCKEINADDSDE